MTEPPAPLVWMAAEPADAEQSRALLRWSRAHGVTLVAALDTGPALIAVDGAVADDVETLLDRAREALSARDPDATDRALASAESLLRAHPELPQAAWLMAEVERARAARFRRIAPTDPEGAERASRRADALDGGRAAAVGEGKPLPPAAPLPVAFQAPAEGPHWSVWLDGIAALSARGMARPGPHAVVVTRDGAPLWASWVETVAESSTVAIGAFDAVPCSRWDVGRARLASTSEELWIDASLVRCPRWVAALPAREAASPGPSRSHGAAPEAAVRVALCGEGACGLMTEWRSPVPASGSPPTDSGRATAGGGWSIGLTSGVVVAAVLVAAASALIASGALQPAPSTTRFVSGGVKTQ